MRKSKTGISALVCSSIAVFFPGAINFGFLGVMNPHWQETFQVGRGAISNSMFFMLVSIGISLPLVGRLQEKYGLRTMMTAGVIICGLNMLIIAFATRLFELYLWASITGLVFSSIYVPGITTVQRWYPARRGLVSGIVNLSFGVSAAAMSPIFAMMLDAMDYVSMNILLTAVTLMVAVPAAQFIDPPTADDLKSEKPEARASAEDESEVGLTVSQSLRTKNFWFLWVIALLQGSAGVSMVTLAVPFGLSRGFALASAAVLLTAFSLGNGFGRLLMGYLSDILGPKLTMSMAFLAAAGAYFLLPHFSALAGMAVAVTFVGAAFGTLMAVVPPLTTVCFGMAHFGAIYGLVLSGHSFFGGILGPALSGHLLDITKENFAIVFTYLGVFCALAGSLIWWVVPPKRQRRVQ